MFPLSRQVKIGIFLVVVISFVSITFYGYQVFFAPNFLAQRYEPKMLYIYPDTDFKTLMDTLNQGGYVGDMISFAFVCKVLGYQENIKAGAYEIQPAANNWDVVRMLKAGNQKPVKVVLNHARLLTEVAEKVCQKLLLPSDSLLKALKNPEITQKFGFDTLNVIGMFIPNTYQMYWTINAETLMKRFHHEYKLFWNKERLAKADSLQLTPQQVTVLASIVQAETRMKDEMPIIAGVYLNRLRIKMPLQADPTLVFASGNFAAKRVTLDMKQIDSPYNTYKYAGLPPGPINTPAAPAIDAVLNYQKHNYLFFCAREDFSGYHNFAEDFATHLQFANTYREALNKANIFK